MFKNLLRGLFAKFASGQKFIVIHAMSCKQEWFNVMKHNDIRGFQENLSKKVCSDVEVEPSL